VYIFHKKADEVLQHCICVLVGVKSGQRNSYT